MTEEEWFEDDPREWNLGGAELEYLEDNLDFEPEIDESLWFATEGIEDLEWQLEILEICLSCGRTIRSDSDGECC